ncbi:MAG: hypothetical protein QXU99_06180 [Candidatus Bathyarchaeia archaeon]
MGEKLDYPTCKKKNCINWREGRCSLKDPEKTDEFCLNFEDVMDSLRLKADAIKGTLS